MLKQINRCCIYLTDVVTGSLDKLIRDPQIIQDVSYNPHIGVFLCQMNKTLHSFKMT